MKSKSIDCFLDRTQKPGYDCLDFACDTWDYLKPDPNDDRLKNFRDSRIVDPRVTFDIVRSFTKLKQPQNPCLVVMHKANIEPHIGVFYEDRILHLPSTCVKFDLPDVAKAFYDRVDYYR
jgi:hypothetical protein